MLAGAMYNNCGHAISMYDVHVSSLLVLCQHYTVHAKLKFHRSSP